MDLKTYLREMNPDSREDFARRCETSLNYLKLVAYRSKKPGEKLCIAIDRESCGAVRCEELRPDVDWGYLRGSSVEQGDIKDQEAA